MASLSITISKIKQWQTYCWWFASKSRIHYHDRTLWTSINKTQESPYQPLIDMHWRTIIKQYWPMLIKHYQPWLPMISRWKQKWAITEYHVPILTTIVVNQDFFLAMVIASLIFGINQSYKMSQPPICNMASGFTINRLGTTTKYGHCVKSRVSYLLRTIWICIYWCSFPSWTKHNNQLPPSTITWKIMIKIMSC